MRPVLLARQASSCLHTGFKPSFPWHCLVRGAYCNQAGTLLFCFGSFLRPHKSVQQPDKEFSRARGKWLVGSKTVLFFSPPLSIWSSCLPDWHPLSMGGENGGGPWGIPKFLRGK